MKTFAITYFSNGDVSCGAPYVLPFSGRDAQEAIAKFNYHYPTRSIWSVDEVNPDYSLEDLNLE